MKSPKNLDIEFHQYRYIFYLPETDQYTARVPRVDKPWLSVRLDNYVTLAEACHARDKYEASQAAAQPAIPVAEMVYA